MNIYINNGNIIIESFRSINIEVGDILKIEFGDKKSNFIVEKNIEENLYNLREFGYWNHKIGTYPEELSECDFEKMEVEKITNKEKIEQLTREDNYL